MAANYTWRLTLGGMLIFAALGASHAAAADGYPNRAIRIIVPIPPGAAADILPRIVAEKLSARWGQPLVIENRPGANSNIGAQAAAQASPDGYTLLATPPPPLVVNQQLYANLGFDPDSFVPVTILARVTNVLVANPKLPFASLAALVRALRHPLLQPIFDLESPRLVFGRVVLLGDAAFVARPHVGTGVTKAALDAATLADVLHAPGADIDAALDRYERERVHYGRRLVARGRSLGAYLQPQLKPREVRDRSELYRHPEVVMRHFGAAGETAV